MLSAPEIGQDVVLAQLGTLAGLLGAGFDLEHYAGLSDEALLEVAGILAQQATLVASQRALVAGELSRRSRPELGHQGLAQSRGMRTPAELVRAAPGSTLREARLSVAVGELALSADPATSERPWLAPVGAAVAEGAIAPEKAEAIRRGLGEPSGSVGGAVLSGAVDTLLAEAPEWDADRLLERARLLRDELDEAGVAERERARRAERSFRLARHADGLTRATWVMDPETAAVVTDIVDRATSPKLGGPRFVDPERVEEAARIAADPRTPAQLASDTLVELLRAGEAADPTLVPGAPSPVRIVVAERDVARGAGRAEIEGQSAPVSVATAERHACAGGVLPITVDGAGRVLDVGRAQRLFTSRQRVALAVRDGGCRFPGCERPPSWTEAHHVVPWSQRGATDLANAVLLCRHHHLLVHDAGWAIRPDAGAPPGAGRFTITAPPGVDAGSAAREMPFRGKVLASVVAGGSG